MKSLIAILIFLGTFMGMFFLMSLVGLLWNDSYYAVVSDHTWFMMYFLFFGWWIAMFPTREYYMKNYQYFQDF